MVAGEAGIPGGKVAEVLELIGGEIVVVTRKGGFGGRRSFCHYEAGAPKLDWEPPEGDHGTLATQPALDASGARLHDHRAPPPPDPAPKVEVKAKRPARRKKDTGEEDIPGIFDAV
jgi:hypothetical protein